MNIAWTDPTTEAYYRNVVRQQLPHRIQSHLSNKAWTYLQRKWKVFPESGYNSKESTERARTAFYNYSSGVADTIGLNSNFNSRNIS